MAGFFSNLISEFAANGKLTAAYLINEIPGITNTPGVVTAFHTAVTDKTPLSYTALALQVLTAAIALQNTTKVVKTAVKQTK